MVSYSQDSNRKELRANFERAVDLIGRDWIERERKKEFVEGGRDHKHEGGPHPLVTRFHRGRIELFDEEIDAPELYDVNHYSDGTHQIVVIGEHLLHLSESNVIDVSGGMVAEDISEHLRPRLHNPDEWRDVLAEIDAAALYAREGFEVDIIEEGPTKAPDLRIRTPSDIYIECKRCSRVSHSDKKHGGLHEAMQKSIRSNLDRESIVIVSIKRTPSGEEAHNIEKHLPDESEIDEYHHIETSFGEIYILPFENPGEPKPVQKHPVSPADTPYEFYDKYVSPAIRDRLDSNIELETFRSRSLQGENIIEAEDNLYLQNPSFIGFLHDSNDDRINQILRQFGKTSGKFPEGAPGILHIEVPFLTELSIDEFNALVSGIGGKLNQSTSISGVVISWHEFTVDPDGSITYGMVVGYIENLTPGVELPPQFDLPGEPLQTLPSILNFKGN